MPYYSCKKCHHEWEGTDQMYICDWCGGDSEVLEQTTSFEKASKEIRAVIEILMKEKEDEISGNNGS